MPAQAAPLSSDPATSSGCQRQHPKPTAERTVLFTLVPRGHAPPNSDLPSHTSESHRAGSSRSRRGFCFSGKNLPVQNPPSAPLRTDLSPSCPAAKQQLLPAPALLGPSWQSIPLLDTRSPGYPQIPSVLPGGGTGWAAGSQIADPAPGVTPALRAAEPPGSLGLALPRTN